MAQVFEQPYPPTTSFPPHDPMAPSAVVCVCCHRVQDEDGRWLPLRGFLEEAANGLVSHGMCVECATQLYPEVFEGDEL